MVTDGGALRLWTWVLGAVVATTAAAQETAYGSAGGWDVASGRTESGQYCAARRTIDGRKVEIRRGAEWSLRFEAGPAQGNVTAFSIDGTTHPLDAARDGDQVVLGLTEASKEAVRNGSRARIELGETAVEIPLNGTAAAGLKVQDCVDQAGVPPVVEGELLVEPGEVVAETGSLGVNCPDRATSVSAEDGAEDTVTLRYAARDGAAMTVFWLDPFGRLLPVPAAFGPESPELELPSYAGQSYVVRDDSGTCRGGLIRATGAAEVHMID